MTEKENKQKIVETSKYITAGGSLFEQIYDPKAKTSYYLGWDKKTEKTVMQQKIEENNIINLPIQDELLEKKAVLLPSNAIDYKDQEELQFQIDTYIQTWLDISDEHRHQAVWYIMLTWVIDKLHTIPYLRALGDTGTGKTRYLDVIGGICYKPMFVGGAVRSAPIYRVIDLWRGTAILDEFTLSKSDESEDIIQILNNGYQRGKPVLRCKSGDYDKVNAFDPFGAKILATRKRFTDRALESRCVTEIMKITGRTDVPIDLTSGFFKQRQELRNQLLMYRFKNWESINPDESITIDFGNILPRIQQSLTPFTVLFQYDKDKLDWFVNYAKKYNNKIIEENADSFDGRLFNAYLYLLQEHEQTQETLDDYNYPTITTSSIKDVLVNDGWKAEDLSAVSIGRRLKTLGFENKPTLVAGKTKKILLLADDRLKFLKRQYLITDITDITDITEQAKKQKSSKNGV